VGTVFNTGAANLGIDTYSGFEGVIGTNFADNLAGSVLNDELRGGIGNDILNGDDGNDILVGGAGADTMSGGAGSDTFVYRSGDAAAVDTISGGFTAGAGGDVLDIADLLVGAFVGNESSYLSLRESGGNTILSIDRDGADTTYGFQDLSCCRA
jgi:Ca2+-binding RTX toxin-like protein